MSSDEPHSRIHNVSNIYFLFYPLSIPLISEGIIPGAYELTEYSMDPVSCKNSG